MPSATRKHGPRRPSAGTPRNAPSRTSGVSIRPSGPSKSPEDVRQLAESARAGVLQPVIDRRYEFTQMAEAHA
ncbi:zinc-binding dehydrogenase [Caulobacter sp. DWR1-3-2b1]|uniref:zinc-binding dehydrogenase n=1 Tax=Caulobacter sp. DWR1-3-2b1 TaxID=2804670 RepID=UPI003CF86C83